MRRALPVAVLCLACTTVAMPVAPEADGGARPGASLDPARDPDHPAGRDAGRPPDPPRTRDAGVAPPDAPRPSDAGPGPDPDPTPTPPDAAVPPAPDAAAPGGACGAQRGAEVAIADGITLCLPPVVCNAETCPPGVGRCVDGRCEFQGGYRGLATFPEAWVTHYCTLSSGGCHGVTQLEFAEITAERVGQRLGLPLCEGGGGGPCVGIAASSPMLVGNSELARDARTSEPVRTWGLGLTEASGLCYEIEGPGGRATVALTDRCGGYCRCGGSGYQECGPCVNAPDLEPSCPCVGTVPGLYGQCCGRNCGGEVRQDCDWCASNNHPHFDLDLGTFDHVCGAEKTNGSCRLGAVRPVPCLDASPAWPPGGGRCQANSFHCEGAMPNQPQVPGTSCCCNWGLAPRPDGTCG